MNKTVFKTLFFFKQKQLINQKQRVFSVENEPKAAIF